MQSHLSQNQVYEAWRCLFNFICTEDKEHELNGDVYKETTDYDNGLSTVLTHCTLVFGLGREF